AMVRTTLELSSMSLGLAGRELWPWSWVLVLGLLASAGVQLAVQWYQGTGRRSGLWGLGLFLLSLAGLFAAAGRGRAGEYWIGGQGFLGQYTVLGVPALYSTYTIWSVFSAGRLGQWLCGGLLLLAAGLYVYNLPLGLDVARTWSGCQTAFLTDLDRET